MRATNRPKCRKCDRAIVVDRYNKHHQKYCAHPECVLARAQERKRKWYSEHYRDPDFCKKEQARCKLGMARIRERREQAGTPPPPELPPSVAGHVLGGLIAKLSNCSDPRSLREQIRRYAEHGRRLSVPLSAFFITAVIFFLCY